MGNSKVMRGSRYANMYRMNESLNGEESFGHFLLILVTNGYLMEDMKWMWCRQ